MEENKDYLLEEEQEIKEEDNSEIEELLRQQAEQRRLEEEKMQAKHERFLGFKKAYNRAGLNVLIFFGILQVVCATFMYIGMALAIFLNGSISFDANSIGELIQNLLSGGIGGEYGYLTGVFYLIGYAITIALTIILNKKLVYGKELPEINIRKLSFGEVMLTLAISFGLWGIGVIVGNFPELIGYGLEDSSVDMIFGDSYILYVVMAVFGGPFIEEIVCRKFFIDKTAKYGETLAVIMSALFFGLMHANSGQFFLALNLGLIMGVIYVKTRNILYTMLIHFCINLWGTITVVTSLIFEGDQSMINFCDEIWNYATLAFIVLGIVMLIIFVFVKKKELFTPKSNNEFAGKLVFKAVGIKTFFIVTFVLSLIQDVLGLVGYAEVEPVNALIGILLSLAVEGIFVGTVLGIKKYIAKTMYPKVIVE